jgi:hypothetical protein
LHEHNGSQPPQRRTLASLEFLRINRGILGGYWWNEAHKIRIAANRWRTAETYNAVVGGRPIGGRFRTLEGAAKASVKHARAQATGQDGES